jgi:virginiamycin B lyase
MYALILTGLATVAAGCSNVGSGSATPIVGNGIKDSTSLPLAARERVRIRQFSDLPGGYSYYFPTSVAAAGGKLWVIDSVDQDYGLDAIVGIATSGKRTNTFHSKYGTGPNDIAAGPDGALWMADGYGGNIIRMTTQGKFTYYPAGRYIYPYNIANGPDDALWFTAASAENGVTGRITTGGAVTIFTAAAETWDIAAGSDGALWFTEPYVNRIGRITTNGKITEYPGINAPYSIASGPDGALWFTEHSQGIGSNGNGIGRITTQGHATFYSSGISPAEVPVDIAAGSDGAMWFTESEDASHGAAEIGRISVSGKIAQYSKNLDPQGGPSGITAGPDGNMWFVETNADKTGRVKL